MPQPKDNKQQLPDKIEVGVYHYSDDEGEPVFDFDEMRDEFESKLKQITGDKYESPS
jgi:hypothetical protein